MANSQFSEFVLNPKDKKVLMDVVKALVDTNQNAVVETVSADIKGNTAYLDMGGKPHLPAHGMEFGKNNSKSMNSHNARSVKLGGDITILFENFKYKVHTPNGTAVIGDSNPDMQTAWRLALRKYEKGIDSLHSTAYYFVDKDLQSVYMGGVSEKEKTTKFQKAVQKLQNMGVTQLKYMSDKQND